jgi:hypothetical protein
MNWLAIDREWTTINQLHADIIPSVSKAQLLEVLEGLGRRCPIETAPRKLMAQQIPRDSGRTPTSFTQQPAVATTANYS